MIDLAQVDVGEDQFVVGGVDDGRPVRAGEHTARGVGTERAQHGRLGAQSYLRGGGGPRSKGWQGWHEALSLYIGHGSEGLMSR